MVCDQKTICKEDKSLVSIVSPVLACYQQIGLNGHVLFILVSFVTPCHIAQAVGCLSMTALFAVWKSNPSEVRSSELALIHHSQFV